MRFRGIPLWGWAAAAALYFGVAAAAVELAWDRSIDALAELGSHRLDLYAASLRSELGRYETMPLIVARQESVRALLSDVPDPPPGLLQTVNDYLDAVNREAASVAVDVIDLHGSVIAASNWNRPDSFVGTNVSYRPYFQDALSHGSGRFFGIGTNTGMPGLYFASAVREGGVAIGATAVKVSVDALESAWRTPGEAAMVIDGNGVIVISTVPAWKFMAVRPIAPEQQSQIQASRQYAGRSVELLPYRRLSDWGTSAWFARFPDWVHPGRERRYLAMSRAAPQAGDSIMVLLDVAGARHQQQIALAFVTGAFLIAGLYGLYAIQRRRAIAEKLKGQDALRSANERLEVTVARRTAALREANERMQQEIVERTRAEQLLRDSQQEVVHAGKLAVLGQMAAGLTHELNQPLVAIKTLCDNARTFFERNQPAPAIGNLERISRLVDSMAVLTAELKTFARKPDFERVAVSLGEAVTHAVLIYEARIRDEHVQLDVRIPAGTTICAEPSQLQQVIVNLLGNALDAVAEQEKRIIAIEARAPDPHGRVLFTVADSGAGIAPEVLAHLFEPFVTTKPRGHGLGLGLAISSRLVNGFGARISAVNPPEGGAQFSIEFAAAAPQGEANE
ncbi:sensor signal transduction histidine kinase [Caballeronia choica]|uniref:C4-dicarboxylate transport sensor protein DctB n=1 Tax=Caballeronia choica TaxID=326476 RepID=A0A158GHJ1_9BURK|nr:ATP-binding protein [Caballeronia choica]SAL31367.1 sensor signal transduction histidine kinase [Caballeronia choica]